MQTSMTLTTTTRDPLHIDEEWLELKLYNGYRVWHILFFIITVFFTLGTFNVVCCIQKL